MLLRIVLLDVVGNPSFTSLVGVVVHLAFAIGMMLPFWFVVMPLLGHLLWECSRSCGFGRGGGGSRSVVPLLKHFVVVRQGIVVPHEWRFTG